ncbi:Uncharacterised protein [Mycobacterium tuberculosis]|nr:Uncharacterised protein [Mycobacterium tuberculosis]
MPHSAAPTRTSGSVGARMNSRIPVAAVAARMRSTSTRPKRSTSGPPKRRTTVIPTENTARATAPVPSAKPCPCSVPSAIQSLAPPSAKDMPSMTVPSR